MSDLIFLGAGASRPFGIPTMQEMVTKFENEIKAENELFEFYSQIKKTLNEQFGSGLVDIEAMLSVVEGISKETKAMDLGHFAFYYISKIGLTSPFDEQEKQIAVKLLEKLKEYIKKSCTINIPSQKIKEVYDLSYVPLFGALKESNYEKFGDKLHLAVGWKAYTSNYDDVFEGFWNNFRVPKDHFDQIQNSDNFVFNPNKLILDEHSFVKLHGSLDWTFNKYSGEVIKKKRSGY